MTPGTKLREWTIEVLLQGDFDSCLWMRQRQDPATDTMKNTFIPGAGFLCGMPGDFAKELVEFFLEHNPQVSQAEVRSQIKRGSICNVAATSPTTFIQASGRNPRQPR